MSENRVPGPTLTQQILESHRIASESGGAPSDGTEAWEVRADHVVFEATSGPLVLAAFEALGTPRARTDVALACLGRDGTHPGFEHGDESRRLVGAARRAGIHVSRPGNGGADAVYRDRFAAPGKLVLAAGEPTPTCGALGSLAFTVGDLAAAVALAGLRHHLSGPSCTVIRLSGSPGPWVSGQDVAHAVGRLWTGPLAPRTVLEFRGAGVASLSMSDRIAVAAYGPALGAAAVIFPSDDVTHAHLRSRGRDADWKPFAIDESVEAAHDLDLDLDSLEPLLAPLEEPAAPRAVRHAMGMKLGRVVIGPQATLADLARVALALEGGRVGAGVEMVVVPGSRALLETPGTADLLERLVACGARWVEGGVPSGPASVSALGGVGLAFGVARATLSARQTAWHIASPETCAASARAGRITDPRESTVEFRREPEPATFAGAERWFLKPAAADESSDAAEATATGALPIGRPLDRPLRGAVLMKVGDRVASEHVLSWGARLDPHSADVRALADHVFAGRDPDFAARARRHRGGFMVAGREFGGGHQREQVALALASLGVRGVLARSLDPEFRARLAQVGILPLRLRVAADERVMTAGDELEIPGLPEALQPGKPLVVRNLTRGTQHALPHDLDRHDLGLVLAGGLLAVAAADSAIVRGATP